MKMLVTACVFFALLLPSNQLFTQEDALLSIRKAARSNALHGIKWSTQPFPFRKDSDYLTERKEALKQQKADSIIEGLPGQPDGPKFSQYSGYITVNASTHRALFYYFTQATHNSSSKPLLLWLNGGPGCSSIGTGAMVELGPFRVNPDGKTLYANPYAWNNEANVLFLESPAGVGFSYSKTQSDYNQNGDTQTAEDNYAFLVNWFRRFPQYRSRDFYIAGESYAGSYVPELAASILEHKKKFQASFMNLKGVMVGNGDMSIVSDDIGEYMYPWSHALISDETYEELIRHCNNISFIHPNNAQCTALQKKMRDEMGKINAYAIYDSTCRNPSSTATVSGQGKADQYNPCMDNYVLKYMNRRSVQKAFHVRKIPYLWTACNSSVFNEWKDYASTALPIYEQLISAGLRILIYSGDTDSVVPVISTRLAIKSLSLSIETPWYSWSQDGIPNSEVGGYSVIYMENFTFATVRGAGHKVPLYQPLRAFTLLRYFLAGQPLPRQQRS